MDDIYPPCQLKEGDRKEQELWTGFTLFFVLPLLAYCASL